MFNGLVTKSRALALLMGVLACNVPVSALDAQSVSPAPKLAMVGTPSRYQPNRFVKRATAYYGLVWGIAALGLKSVESGEIIRFSYRVLHPNKAKLLNDKKFEPSVINPSAGVKLVVPSMEKVGQLRQSSAPKSLSENK